MAVPTDQPLSHTSNGPSFGRLLRSGVLVRTVLSSQVAGDTARYENRTKGDEQCGTSR